MAVMSALVFYMIPGLLGRGYNMKNDTVGPDLFEVKETNKAQIIKKYLTTCEYKVVSEMSEAMDFLGVNGKLGLKMKVGSAHLGATGKYLNVAESLDNSVDILVKVYFETITKTMGSDLKPIPNWSKMADNSGCTHYTRSITYGGALIASLRLRVKNDKDKETIKGMVEGGLNSKSGSFGGALKGDMEKILEKTSEMADIEINYYATVPLSNVTYTMEGLMELVDKFPEQAKQVNHGYGVPLKMEVFSLEALNKDRKTFYQTLAFRDQMDTCVEKMDDIEQANMRLSDWMLTLPPNLPKEQNDKIGKFATKLSNIYRIFCEVIANLDLSPEAKGDQFKRAFEAYRGGKEEVIPNEYVKQLSRLKKEILDSTPSLEGDFGGCHYTRWGADTCPTETIQVFNGVMSTTDGNSIGSFQYTCLPKDRQYPRDKTGDGDDNEIDDYPKLQQVGFVSRKKGADKKKKTIKCASCRVPGKSASTMLPAQTKCPSGWKKQYEGVLISTDFQQVRGELVCLDTSRPFENVPSNLEHWTVVTEASPKCGSFPCSDGVSVTTALPCVVCSITKKSSSKTDFHAL